MTWMEPKDFRFDEDETKSIDATFITLNEEIITMWTRVANRICDIKDGQRE